MPSLVADADVGREGELEADPHRVTVEGGDDRHRRLVHVLGEDVDPAAARRRLDRPLGLGLLDQDPVDFEVGDELARPAAGEDNRRDLARRPLGDELLELADVLIGVVVHRRPVEPGDDDATISLAERPHGTRVLRRIDVDAGFLRKR
jgi:hypothetical protein